MAERETLLVAGTLGPLAAGAGEALAARDFQVRHLGEVASEDITRGYAYVDNDACVAAVATVGQYLRALEACESGAAVLSAQLCRDCRALSQTSLLRMALRRAGRADVHVVEATDADLRAFAPAPPAEADVRAEFGDMVDVVGICGPVPVLTTGEFKRTVLERLHGAGLRSVMPPLAHIVGERDTFEPALRYFSALGVHTAICILPFGCMSGHAFARGQLRAMQKKYPDIEVTMLDFDPSASDVNLVNRVELVMQSVRDRGGAAELLDIPLSTKRVTGGAHTATSSGGALPKLEHSDEGGVWVDGAESTAIEEERRAVRQRAPKPAPQPEEGSERSVPNAGVFNALGGSHLEVLQAMPHAEKVQNPPLPSAPPGAQPDGRG